MSTLYLHSSLGAYLGLGFVEWDSSTKASKKGRSGFLAWCLLKAIISSETDIDNYYETILQDLSYIFLFLLSYIFREDRRVNVREGKRLLWKGWAWWQWGFCSGQALCGIVLWRSTYQNWPSEAFWPVCAILPEHRSATKRAVLQPSLIEDHLSGETTPFFLDCTGMTGFGKKRKSYMVWKETRAWNDWLWNHGWIFLLLGGMILGAVSYSLSVRKKGKCLDINYCSLFLLAILHSCRFYKHHGSQGSYLWVLVAHSDQRKQLSFG